jgi:hypothetical protein
MALNLSGVFGDIGNLAGSVSGQDVLNSILAGAAGTVVISGLKSGEGQDAIDPLHIFHKPATPTSPAASGVVQGQVMTMTKFLTLTPDQQKMIQAMGYTIVPG